MQRAIQPQHKLSTQETEQLYRQGTRLAEVPRADSDWVVLQVLDSRRAGLELYLQSLASLDPLPTELVEFLNLQDSRIRISQNKITSGNTTSNIQDIY